MKEPHRRRLKRRKGIYFQRKLRRLAGDVAAGRMTLAEFAASLRSWINHVRYANTVGLRKALLGKLRLLPPAPKRPGATTR